MYCYIHFNLVMNSSQRFVSSLWESLFLFLHSLRFLSVSTYPLQLFPINQTRWPIIPKVSNYPFFRIFYSFRTFSVYQLSSFLSFPSRYFSLSITLFFCLHSRRFYFLLSIFHIRIYSLFFFFPFINRWTFHPPFLSFTTSISSLSLLFSIDFQVLIDFARHYSRSLCWFPTRY